MKWIDQEKFTLTYVAAVVVVAAAVVFDGDLIMLLVSKLYSTE
jgi:hypothetical protein